MAVWETEKGGGEWERNVRREWKATDYNKRKDDIVEVTQSRWRGGGER